MLPWVRLVKRSSASRTRGASAAPTAKVLQRTMITFEPVHPDAGLVALASGPNPSAARRKAAELSAFFERLRQCLDARGMTQADLARELGVGVATVSEWFTRGRVPNGDAVLRLPHTLAVNGHWLLTGEGPRDIKRRRGGDPYLRGAQDALSHLSHCLEEAARRFGTEVPLGPGTESQATSSAGEPPQA